MLAGIAFAAGADAAPRHHRAAHARPARAGQRTQARLAAAQAVRAADLQALQLAAAKAARDQARAIALSARARNEAARLRETETRASDTLSRIDALQGRRQALEAELARDAAALAPILPLALRLATDPEATLLAAPATPADAVTGLMVLRAFAAQLEIRSQQIRARQRELTGLVDALRGEGQALTALRQEQLARGAAVTASAQQAAAAQRSSQDAADAAARQAASSAARAATLQDAVSRLDAAQRAAESRFQRAAAAAEHARRPEIARAARASAASVNLEPGPGLRIGSADVARRDIGRPDIARPDIARPDIARPDSASPDSGTLARRPVAGRLVIGWGSATDAGPATGLTYAPPALAAVTAPCDGRIEFAGGFRSYGKMVILNCGHGYRFVLAGLDRLDVAVGQKLARGVAVGRMPDWTLSDRSRPSLYLQLRKGSTAIDPTGFLQGHS